MPASKQLLALFVLLLSVSAAQSLSVLDSEARATTAITDGDLISLRADLPKAASETTVLSFALEPDQELASCRVSVGETGCSSPPQHALGWYWSRSGEPQANVRLKVVTSRSETVAESIIEISPRPVILVHGYNSSAATWQAYLGEDGFLAPLNLSGFAIGEPAEAGALKLGDLSQPRAPTLTLAENADVLANYIARVKRASGAQMVDLVAHSMGGLVARMYIARVMQERDVAQLITLGTPNGGSACARLPVSLGFAMPASLELRPSYVQAVLNPQLTERRDVPFAMLAGTPIKSAARAPCTNAPTDLVVSRSSAGGIGQVVEMPVTHGNMTASNDVFEGFVTPNLKRPVGAFEPYLDEFVPLVQTEAAQVTRTFSGTLEPGEAREFTIFLDSVVVASFALYDPSLSLEASVRGASGALIDLEANADGFLELEDPNALFQLGYGFDNPKPGTWLVTLSAADTAPIEGAPFALSAQVVGGAQLTATSSTLLPELAETVTLSAQFEGEVQTEDIRALIRLPNGALEELTFGEDGKTTWQPKQRGLHSIDVVARAQTEDLVIERTVPLAVEVR